MSWPWRSDQPGSTISPAPASHNATAPLQADNDQLRKKLADLRAEHTRLKEQVVTYARVIHVLEVENTQLREQSQASDVVRPLQRQTH